MNRLCRLILLGPIFLAAQTLPAGELTQGPWLYSTLYTTPSGLRSARVQPGLDILAAEFFAPLKGKTVGVVTNHTGRTRDGQFIQNLVAVAPGVRLRALFGPEHGFTGNLSAGQRVADDSDTDTGVRIFSLYGENTKPTPEQLAGINVVLLDLQDVGARYYTYVSTLTMVMEACAELGIAVWVLDRPNPVRGDYMAGPILEPEYASFVGMHTVPIRHGLTLGEMAIMINEQGWLPGGVHVDLTVVPVAGWRATMWWDQTDLVWIPPSPNIPDAETALAYLGMCLFEGTNISEGRGTLSPFSLIGAPWIDGVALARLLNRQGLPGVDFVAATFEPRSIEGMAEYPKYEGQECGGIRLRITDRNTFQPIHTAAVMIHILRETYPRRFAWNTVHMDRLWGSDAFRNYIDYGRNIAAHPSTYAADRDAFYSLRQPYLIYER
ncbi:exo-beta-N-acetylmuramidase NamZ domain-containing protein [Candidatus Neomarinimicrobiota bacterium]